MFRKGISKCLRCADFWIAFLEIYILLTIECCCFLSCPRWTRNTVEHWMLLFSQLSTMNQKYCWPLNVVVFSAVQYEPEILLTIECCFLSCPLWTRNTVDHWMLLFSRLSTMNQKYCWPLNVVLLTIECCCFLSCPLWTRNTVDHWMLLFSQLSTMNQKYCWPLNVVLLTIECCCFLSCPLWTRNTVDHWMLYCWPLNVVVFSAVHYEPEILLTIECCCFLSCPLWTRNTVDHWMLLFSQLSTMNQKYCWPLNVVVFSAVHYEPEILLTIECCCFLSCPLWTRNTVDHWMLLFSQLSTMNQKYCWPLNVVVFLAVHYEPEILLTIECCCFLSCPL